uniref:Uncharacterized protein n=1 Tax=Quercus lobata TaxID=97700 RepID=A0A7N2MDD3_QUELO
MQAEEPVNSPDMVVPEINTLILIGRSLLLLKVDIPRLQVDMVTPMLSQLTYEGLLDECLHVNNGSVELDASIMGLQQEGKKIKVPLNSSDKLFKEIQDLNFEVVIQILRQKATSMKQDYTEVTTTTQSVSELKDFVKKLNSLPEMILSIFLLLIFHFRDLYEGMAYDLIVVTTKIVSGHSLAETFVERKCRASYALGGYQKIENGTHNPNHGGQI